MINLGSDKKKNLKVILKFIFIFGLVGGLFFTQNLLGNAASQNNSEEGQLNSVINDMFQKPKKNNNR